MKHLLVPLNARCGLLAVTLLFASTHARAVTTLTITPSSVSNTYSGYINFQVGGIPAGHSVLVQEYNDANTNGVVDAGDLLLYQSSWTDGQAGMVIGGVTNINVLGDTDAVAGQITARWNFQNGGINFVGKYLVRLSSPTADFSPFTTPFAITNAPYAQRVAGNVVSGGTNVPNAVVILFSPPSASGGGLNPVAGTVANNSGAYSIQAAPGAYVLLAFKSNYVASFTATPFVTLNSGATVTTNVPLTNTTQTISGKIVDAANPGVGLPGLLVPASGESNSWFTVGFADTNGNFRIGTRPDVWKIQKDETGAGTYGYVVPQHNEQVDTSTGSVADVTISLPKATALFSGHITNNLGQALAGGDITSFDSGQYESDTRTDINGFYTIGALCGDTWQVQIASDINAFTNYIFSQPAMNQNGGTNLPCGPATAAEVNFTALLATNHINGHVQQNNGQPVPGVQVVASAVIGGAFYATAVDTDGSGNYSLNVANGDWNVSVSCQGGQDSLDAILGGGTYQCPGSKNISITNNNGTASFTVLPCGGIEVITSSPLPNGQVGSYYSIQFNASSCNGNFNWSLNSGTVPPGLNLYSGGAFNGTPTTNGTFNFVVHVSDGGGSSTNQNFSITINPAPAPPTLGTPAKSGSQLQFSVSAQAFQNYTVQMSTNLGSTNWASIFVTNPPVNSFLFTDPNATNPMRFYRILLGP